MSTKKLYIEGGGDSKELHSRCREGFRKLLEKCGFKGRMPRLTACGGRESALDSFRIAHTNASPGDYVALLIDSESAVEDIDKPWKHLKAYEGCATPAGASDEQAFFMTTCMETWISADREALRNRYTQGLQEGALPSLQNLENRSKKEMLSALEHATRSHNAQYKKGAESFRLVANLNPIELRKYLPSFVRFERILGKYL